MKYFALPALAALLLTGCSWLEPLRDSTGTVVAPPPLADVVAAVTEGAGAGVEAFITNPTVLGGIAAVLAGGAAGTALYIRRKRIRDELIEDFEDDE